MAESEPVDRPPYLSHLPDDEESAGGAVAGAEPVGLPEGDEPPPLLPPGDGDGPPSAEPA